jgi:heat shock protein beta
VEDNEATQKKLDEWEAKKAEEGEEKAGDKPGPVMKTDWQTEWDWRKSNESKPLWVRSSSEVEKAEYDEFFKATFKEFLEPLAYNHFNVEGQIEFKALLYVPGMAPFEQQDMLKRSKSMKLFVKRVFISDEFDEDLMPRYLNFVKGIVDSNDLPLNVSREILQEQGGAHHQAPSARQEPGHDC